MDARSALGQEAADRASPVDRLEEFDLGVAELEVDDLGAIGFLGPAGRHLQDVTIEAKGGIHVRHGDANVRDSGLHGGNLT